MIIYIINSSYPPLNNTYYHHSSVLYSHKIPQLVRRLISHILSYNLSFYIEVHNNETEVYLLLLLFVHGSVKPRGFSTYQESDQSRLNEKDISNLIIVLRCNLKTIINNNPNTMLNINQTNLEHEIITLSIFNTHFILLFSL